MKALVWSALLKAHIWQLIVWQEGIGSPVGSGTPWGQQSSQAAVFRLVLPPELVLPLHSCVDSCTQTLHYRLPGDCFLNEHINVMNFVLAKKLRLLFQLQAEIVIPTLNTTDLEQCFFFIHQTLLAFTAHFLNSCFWSSIPLSWAGLAFPFLDS